MLYRVAQRYPLSAAQRLGIFSPHRSIQQVPSRSPSISAGRLEQAKSTPPAAPKSTPPPPPRKEPNQLPILPLVAIFGLGSFLFYRLVKEREGKSPKRAPAQPPKIDDLPVDRRKYREG